jgi:hypothetical protein
MMQFPYWIQHCDLSATDFEPVDVNGALSALSTYDWNAELEILTELEQYAIESCPPGIGFVAPTGILHICPGSDGRALVHYHTETPGKVLGFIPRSYQSVRTKQHVEESDVVEMIQFFFQGRHDLLLSKFVN